MTVWDTGTYRLHKWNEGKEVIITLFGQPTGGLGGVRKFALIHTGGGDSQPEKNWLMHLMETDPEDMLGPSTGSGHMITNDEPQAMRPEPQAKRPEPQAMRPEPQAMRPEPVEGLRAQADIDFPEQVEPKLATLTDATHCGDEEGWAVERKGDGVRAVA